MRRKTRAHSIRHQPFNYEEHGIYREKLPLFITVVLDNYHKTLEDREDFYEKFVHEYLNNSEFRKNTKDQVLVFEGPKYIDYTHRENISEIGTYGKVKSIINIGELSNVF